MPGFLRPGSRVGPKVNRARKLPFFGPSQEWSDYRVEWRAGAAARLGWVFRAQDAENYYAIRLNQDPSGAFQFVRYAVIEGSRVEMGTASLQSLGDGDRLPAIELLIEGVQFVFYIDGKRVARWTDDRLPRGGFGVMRPDSGLAGVNEVKVTQLERQSAREEHYWKGAVPKSLPEVTLISAAPGGKRRRGPNGGSTL